MGKVKAACLIIGDEVLNGKVVDSNSTYFAQFCYKHGIDLKEIAVVGDVETDIMETIRRLASKYDFIITTGGIGPTHDDITYRVIAKSFGLPCVLNETVKARMNEKSDHAKRLTESQLKDYYIMATLPSGSNVENYFPIEDLWVPICSIDKKVYIFPGIPQLFEKMLTGFLENIISIYKLESSNKLEYCRYYVKTKKTESMIAQYLREIQEESEKISPEIKIGSYPHYGMGFNTVSILGTKQNDSFLKQLAQRTIQQLKGEQISEEEEFKVSNSH